MTSGDLKSKEGDRVENRGRESKQMEEWERWRECRGRVRDIEKRVRVREGERCAEKNMREGGKMVSS